MSIVVLARHGETDWNRSGQIMGDQPVPLNARGEMQARDLADALAGLSFAALYTSPVHRAVQTAQRLASSLQTEPRMAAGLREIGVGEWASRYWKDLADEPVKREFYSRPHEARPPGGETLLEVQRRAVSVIEEARSNIAMGRLLFVSHADVIRTVLAHYLQIDLVTLRRVQISPASATALEFDDAGTHLLFLNYTPSAPQVLTLP